MRYLTHLQLVQLCSIEEKVQSSESDQFDDEEKLFLTEEKIYFKHDDSGVEFSYYPLYNTVVFGSTNEFNDWKNNLNFLPVEYKGIYFHQGFLRQFIACIDKLKEVINKDTLLTFTGHSLGGALSQIASWYFHGDGYSVRMVSFGAPRSAYKGLANYFKKNDIDSFSYIETNDIVPSLPKSPFKQPELHRIYLGKGKFITLDEKINFWYILYVLKKTLIWFKKKPTHWHKIEQYKNSLESYFSKTV